MKADVKAKNKYVNCKFSELNKHFWCLSALKKDLIS